MNRRALIEAIETHTSYSFSRSSGAGGQNVNKVNTRVSARLPLSVLTMLTEVELSRIRSRLAGRITASQEILVTVQEERSQQRNRAIALGRMRRLVLEGVAERRHRRPTAPSRAARLARLDAKRRRGRTKRDRRRPGPEEG